MKDHLNKKVAEVDAFDPQDFTRGRRKWRDLACYSIGIVAHGKQSQKLLVGIQETNKNNQ